MKKITASTVANDVENMNSLNSTRSKHRPGSRKTKLCTTIAILLLVTSIPLRVNAFRIMAPRTIYTHIDLKKLISIYRNSYKKIGMKDMSTQIEARQTFSDREKQLIETIQFSYPKNKVKNKNGSTSFSIDAYTKNGMCIECVVVRQTFSSEAYQADWRATKYIRQALGKSGAPMCPTACPASVEEWINDKTGKMSIPNIDPYTGRQIP